MQDEAMDGRMDFNNIEKSVAAWDQRQGVPWRVDKGTKIRYKEWASGDNSGIEV